MKIIIKLLINTAALLVIAYFLPGINVSSVYIAFITAIILGLINISIRPLVKLLTLPLTILTLGLFALIINALFFWFVATFVDGFAVSGFGAAFIGALVMSIVAWATNQLLKTN